MQCKSLIVADDKGNTCQVRYLNFSDKNILRVLKIFKSYIHSNMVIGLGWLTYLICDLLIHSFINSTCICVGKYIYVHIYTCPGPG